MITSFNPDRQVLKSPLNLAQNRSFLFKIGK